MKRTRKTYTTEEVIKARDIWSEIYASGETLTRQEMMELPQNNPDNGNPDLCTLATGQQYVWDLGRSVWVRFR